MSLSRVNPDGSVTYWHEGADEPAKQEKPKAEAKAEDKTAEPEQAKVVESPEPKKAAGRSRASTK